MRDALAVAGAGVAAALCCLAIPVTVGIIGLSDLAAFGINLGALAIIASALVVAWAMRSRAHRDANGSGDRDG